MALQSILGGMYWPDRFAVNYESSASFMMTSGGMTLDGSGDGIAYCFQAPATGTLDGIKFYVTTLTSSGDVEVAIQALNATGQPDGSDIGSIATVTTGSANSVYTAAVSASVTIGTWYAVVIRWVSGNRVVRCWGGTSANAPRGYSPAAYVRTNSGGAGWTTISSTASRHLTPNFTLTIGGVYSWVSGVRAASAFSNTTFNNTSATRERGASIVMPFPATVVGAFYLGAYSANADLILAATSGTAILTTSVDSDYGGTWYTTTAYPGLHIVMFPGTYDIAAGENAYLTLKPTSATNISLPDITILDTGVADTIKAWNGGDKLKLVTRDSGGTYTVDATKRPLEMGLILSKFDDGAGGGAANIFMGSPNHLLRM